MTGDRAQQRVLVTGCCGFIGSNLVSSLVTSGYLVDGIDDMRSGTIQNIYDVNDELSLRVVPAPVVMPVWEKTYESAESRPDILIFEGDCCHQSIIRRIANGIYDVVVHLAADPSVENSIHYPVSTAFNNVQKCTELFNICARSNTKVIFASSAAIYGDQGGEKASLGSSPQPQTPYALQKLHAEQTGQLFSQVYGLQFISLRLFNVYGPTQKGSDAYATVIAAWLHKIKNNLPLRIDGDGSQTRDHVHISDVCTAFIGAMSYEGQFNVFNVGTGTETSNTEILTVLRNKFDITIEQADFREGDISHSVADIDLTISELNFTPTVDVNTGITNIVEAKTFVIREHYE